MYTHYRLSSLVLTVDLLSLASSSMALLLLVRLWDWVACARRQSTTSGRATPWTARHCRAIHCSLNCDVGSVSRSSLSSYRTTHIRM